MTFPSIVAQVRGSLSFSNVIALLALAVLTLAAPSAHAGARQAWDVEAAEGSYTITMTADDPIDCESLEPGSGTWRQTLTGTYRTSFTGRGLGRRGPWFKYFPYLRGPASPGPVGVSFAVESTSTEWRRVVEAGSPEDGIPCKRNIDQGCDYKRISRTGKGYFALGARTRGSRVEIGMPIIGATSIASACRGAYSDSLLPHYPGDSISPQLSTAVPLASFRHGSLVLRFRGKKAVKKEGGGFSRGSGTLEWSAVVKLRKVVLSEGCKEVRGRSGFVCRP